MKKECRIGNKLSYIRHKTESKRGEDGRMIITIPEPILYLFDKYKGVKRLLSFSDQINTEKNFLKMIDLGFVEISTIMGNDKISSYYFRISWATIAQNKCDASTELVAFCLNHASAHKVTSGYIEKDFKKVDILNEKVIHYVFGRRRIFHYFKLIKIN